MSLVKVKNLDERFKGTLLLTNDKKKN